MRRDHPGRWFQTRLLVIEYRVAWHGSPWVKLCLKTNDAFSQSRTGIDANEKGALVEPLFLREGAIGIIHGAPSGCLPSCDATAGAKPGHASTLAGCRAAADKGSAANRLWKLFSSTLSILRQWYWPVPRGLVRWFKKASGQRAC